MNDDEDDGAKEELYQKIMDNTASYVSPWL
jgi:hypothetical protein